MNRVESFARALDTGVTAAVRLASSIKTNSRLDALRRSFSDPEGATSAASEIKDYVLENFNELLAQFEANAKANGILVHKAGTPEEARSIIVSLCQAAKGPIVKGKSMATEEIHLNSALIEAGHEVVETDLGEFVVQLDGDTPSHIVTPIIHRTRRDVARTFLKAEIGSYTEDPAELAMQARRFLRQKFKAAAVGVSGVNFAIAETGRLVIIENEGNNRLSTTAPDIHIAVMGIEKLLPAEADLALFLPLLAGSATGQQLTVYSHFISGPRRDDELDGPRQVHLVLLDSGRRKILDSKFKEILKCIRCGACLNVCPVYRQVSGHGYRHVYPGPIGAVLAPLLDPSLSDLPKASTLCGACHEVCPVKIPISDLLVLHRSKGATSESLTDAGFTTSALNPKLWKTSRRFAGMVMGSTAWNEFHQTPEPQPDFRNWWKSRSTQTFRAKGSLGQGRGDAEEQVGDPALAPVKPTLAPLFEKTKSSLASLGIALITAKTVEQGLTMLMELRPNMSVVCGKELLTAIAGAGFGLKDVWSAQAGITYVDALIAETGTLVISAGTGKLRKASLCPLIHVAVVKRSQIVETLAEAITNLDMRTTVFITGPSRTADIEGVLVKGVHGPGEVVVILVDG